MTQHNGLHKHLSPLGAWSFAIGTSVGWGSLVVTANTYLAQAGPAGSVLGLILGTVIMLVIGLNYAYLMCSYPEAGGAYAYAREAFSYDAGFLAAWFLAMTYFAVLWANATSLPLFARIFMGNLFRFGKLYTIFDYDVYIGEVLLSMAALALAAMFYIKCRKLTDILMIILALLFTAGISICFLWAITHGGSEAMQPGYVPDSRAISQIAKIAVISPWAYIGFESISHSTGEFDFERSRIRRLMVIAVISTLLIYVFVILLSVTAYPEGYASWLDYIRDLDNQSGLEALPAFYAANHYMGSFGVVLLMLSLLALVITSLFGNTAALSRLFYAMAEDEILPKSFSHINAQGIPDRAVMLVTCVSLFIPLVGRTAIGWIVDVTTIGATLIYGIVAASCIKLAGRTGDRHAVWLGRAALLLMIAFGLYILLPNLVSRGSFAKETYLLLIFWSVFGFLFFRSILHRDSKQRFGSSVIIWVTLLALVLLISLIWMQQSLLATSDAVRETIHSYYSTPENPDSLRLADEAFIDSQIDRAQAADTRTMLMTFGMFSFALVIMLTNHNYMVRKNRENETLANIDPMTGVKNSHAYLVWEQKKNAELKAGNLNDFSIVVCDVNNLKIINDTLGHKAGDQYILDACAMICDVFKHSPVFRVGGDEFTVVLTGRDYANRQQLMDTLHEQSVERIRQGRAVVSGGISDFDAETDDHVLEVFERADQQMYEEKKRLKTLGASTRE